MTLQRASDLQEQQKQQQNIKEQQQDKKNIEHLKNELKGLVLGLKPKPKHKKRIHF